LWLYSLQVAQLLRSAAFLHTNQSRSYLNHLVRTTCPTYLILLDLITPLTFPEVISFLLCSLLHCPVTSSLCTKSSSPPNSRTPSACVPPQCKRQSFTPIHNKRCYSSVCLNPYSSDSKLHRMIANIL